MKKLSAVFLSLLLAPAVLAEEKAAPLTPEQKADAAALLGLVGEFTKAFDAGDAKAISATFTEDAQIHDENGETKGRAAIESRFGDYFANTPKSKIEIKVNSLQFVSPDVIIENGHSIIKGVEDESRVERTKYSVVYVRQNGKWLQSCLTDRASDGRSVPERLKELEWLVGDWVTESDQAVVSTSVKWSDDQHYLLRDFTIMVDGKTAIKGTQRIGWDPAKKHIRSWLFDSKGGFSEGEWSHADKGWVIKTRGVSHDGTSATATQMLVQVGKDHVRWSSFDRTEGDEAAPDLEEITLVRKPPAPK